MGYYMTLLESNFRIRAERHHEALQAVKGLIGKETTGRAGDMHFMWVYPSEFVGATSLIGVLHTWRWLVELDSSGNINEIIEFLGEKYGDEDLLFSTLAPFVEKGSYITMLGEDGIIWRWFFHNFQVQKQFGRIVFDDRAQKEVRKKVFSDADCGWPHFKGNYKVDIYGNG